MCQFLPQLLVLTRVLWPQVLGKENTHLVREHVTLEKKIMETRAQIAKMKRPSQRPKVQRLLGDISTMQDILKESGQQMIRILRLKREEVHALAAEFQTSGEKSAGYVSFVSCYGSLRDIMYQRFLSSVEEDKNREQFKNDMDARAKKASAEVKALRSQLSEAKRSRERDLADCNTLITQLRDRLQEVKTSTSLSMKTFREDQSHADKSDMTEFSENEGILEARLKSLTAEVDNLRLSNKDNELQLRKKKFKHEQEVENWVGRFDSDMGEKEREYNEITDSLADINRQLDDMKRNYALVDRKRAEVEAHEVNVDKEQEAVDGVIRRYDFAATLIQSLWKGVVQRRVFEKMKKDEAKRRKKAAKGAKKKKK